MAHLVERSKYVLGLVLLLGLVACQPAPLTTKQLLPGTKATLISQSVPLRAYPELHKPNTQAQVSLQGQTVTLNLTLPPLPKKQSSDSDLLPGPLADALPYGTQALDLTPAQKITASVRDSHGQVYYAVGADAAHQVAYPPGGVLALTFNNVVPDPLLFVNLQLVDTGSADIVQADLSAVLSHTGNTPASTTMNFQTTALAKTMSTLLTDNPNRAREIDLSALSGLMTTITGIMGTDPNFSYPQNHPSLVKTGLLATALVSQAPGELTASASDYRGVGGTVNLTVSGLQGSDKIQVQITDAASAVKTNLGTGSGAGFDISGVTPGSGLKVKASPFGTPSLTYTYAVSLSSLSLSESGSENVTITATPNLSVSSFSPAFGLVGSTVTITGTNFTGATAVRFNGVDASSFSVNSSTQITATVPAGASTGLITVVNGGSASSATPFTVLRTRYVKADATGSNDGTNWDNAYTDLQTALAASDAGDQIWVAAGTYKPVVPVSPTAPTAGERGISFQLKANVNIYGGFAGTENSLAERTPSQTDFVTYLSGDIDNTADDYTGTPATGITNNSITVVKGSNNTLLDGVTIRGGNNTTGNGGGMLNTGVSPTLTHVTLSHNSALRGGGMYNAASANPTLTNVNLNNNTATNSTDAGAGMYNTASQPSLTQVSFTGNRTTGSSGQGAGMYNSGAGSTATLTQVSFISNQAIGVAGLGGGMYNTGASPTLTNVVFSQNSAPNGAGGLYTTLGAPVLTHVTFNRNSSVNLSSESGIYRFSGIPVLRNVLFYLSNHTSQALGSGQGNVDAVTDPFVSSTSPNGLPRTADDGLLLTNTAAILNQGINAGVTSDILGNGRVGAPDSGAYENQTVSVAITGFSPATGAPGSSVTLTGTSFTGTTAVNFNGTPASFTVDSDTQITASVPANATEGTLTVVNGFTATSTSPFDVQRILRVNATASGSNNGVSWPNAYINLQTALAVAAAGDQIWVAAGSYKPIVPASPSAPTALERGVAFQLKENVNLYGGFAGTENLLTDRTASLTDFVTYLSGDIDSTADNYASTPGTGLTLNSMTVVRGANNTLLDGVTIRGGFSTTSNGGGMTNTNVSPTLTNVTFSNNSALRGGGMYNASNANPNLTNVSFNNNAATTSSSDGGGGMNNNNSRPTLNQVSFSGNRASLAGGGMININNANAILTNVSFTGNTAPLGGGVYNEISAPSLTAVSFTSNTSSSSGGGVYNNSSNPTFNGVSLISNTASSSGGGGMANNNSSPSLTNAIFSHNTAPNGGAGLLNAGTSGPVLTHVTFNTNLSTMMGTEGGIYNLSGLTGVPVLKNVLFYLSSHASQALGAGCVDLGNDFTAIDPFIDSGNPNGPDGLPRTADDGLRLVSSASAVLNMGIDAGVTLDILGLGRNGNPEPGAYEFQ